MTPTQRALMLERRRELLETLAERFWAKVDMNGPNGCWLWTGATDSGGYGAFRALWETKAHRASLMLAGVEIPEGHHVDHVCMVKRCVNPAHLEPVTPAENVRRWRASMQRAM